MTASTTERETVYRFTLQPAEISINRVHVERGLGYMKGSAPDVVSQLIDEILPHVADHVEIQCGFRILPPERVTIVHDSIACNGVTFTPGPVIAKRLRRSHTLGLFAATVGPGLERWSRELMAGPDGVKGYVVDVIASVAVEQVVDWLESKLEETVRPFGWNVTHRYSPGHCDWSVAEQHKLFSCLPEGFCGISLTPTALMIPIKSVSGVVGLGPLVKREDPQCSLCDMKDCYRRLDDSGDE